MPLDLTKRALIAGVGALGATAAIAQTSPALASRVVIQTALGSIVIELAADKAPITCANFLRYVDAGRLNGGTFYRALKILPDPLTGLIQGGVKNDPAKAFPPIAHESTRITGLTHKDGAVSMARYDPGTATSEFFICIGDLSSLDAAADPAGDPGFAVFAHVIEGMAVAKAILTAPIDPTKGEEDHMKGQLLGPEIGISALKRA